ncbi:MAG: sensor histidine kinase [Dehalococcoidia bacterium]
MARTAAADCNDDDLRARCESIVNAAERMLRTAGHLMVVAETSKTTSPTVFDARGIIAGVVDDYREMGVHIGVRFETRQPILLDSSPATLEALLCSLLGNAIDHGGPDEVTVRVRSDETACEVRVENSISHSLKHRGIGLGTYIGGKLVEEMSGTLHAERTEATFGVTFRVPLAHRMQVAV